MLHHQLAAIADKHAALEGSNRSPELQALFALLQHPEVAGLAWDARLPKSIMMSLHQELAIKSRNPQHAALQESIRQEFQLCISEVHKLACESIFEYLPDDNDRKNLAMRNRTLFFTYYGQDPFLNALLNHTVRHEVHEVKKLLGKKPHLVLLQGQVQFKGVTYTGITAFQYALWARDIAMCDALMPHLTAVEAYSQVKELEKFGLGRKHGQHYNHDILLQAYKDLFSFKERRQNVDGSAIFNNLLQAQYAAPSHYLFQLAYATTWYERKDTDFRESLYSVRTPYNPQLLVLQRHMTAPTPRKNYSLSFSDHYIQPFVPRPNSEYIRLPKPSEGKLFVRGNQVSPEFYIKENAHALIGGRRTVCLVIDAYNLGLLRDFGDGEVERIKNDLTTIINIHQERDTHANAIK